MLPMAAMTAPICRALRLVMTSPFRRTSGILSELLSPQGLGSDTRAGWAEYSGQDPVDSNHGPYLR